MVMAMMCPREFHCVFESTVGGEVCQGSARACLAPRGRLYLVARTSQGAQTLGRLMGEIYPRVAEVERGGGFRVYEASDV